MIYPLSCYYCIMKTTSNIYTLFTDWLNENESQLIVPLIRAPYKKGKIYYFKDIPESPLSLQIDDDGIVVMVYHDDEAVEMILDLDAVSGYKRGKGYFCRLCIEPVYYSSIKEFYTNHCFEKLKIWINTKLTQSEFIDIFFFGGRDGSSCAQLSIDIITKKKYILKMKSLFKNAGVEKIRVKLCKS